MRLNIQSKYSKLMVITTPEYTSQHLIDYLNTLGITCNSITNKEGFTLLSSYLLKDACLDNDILIALNILKTQETDCDDLKSQTIKPKRSKDFRPNLGEKDNTTNTPRTDNRFQDTLERINGPKTIVQPLNSEMIQEDDNDLNDNGVEKATQKEMMLVEKVTMAVPTSVVSITTSPTTTTILTKKCIPNPRIKEKDIQKMKELDSTDYALSHKLEGKEIVFVVDKYISLLPTRKEKVVKKKKLDSDDVLDKDTSKKVKSMMENSVPETLTTTAVESTRKEKVVKKKKLDSDDVPDKDTSKKVKLLRDDESIDDIPNTKSIDKMIEKKNVESNDAHDTFDKVLPSKRVKIVKDKNVERDSFVKNVSHSTEEDVQLVLRVEPLKEVRKLKDENVKVVEKGANSLDLNLVEMMSNVKDVILKETTAPVLTKRKSIVKERKVLKEVSTHILDGPKDDSMILEDDSVGLIQKETVTDMTKPLDETKTFNEDTMEKNLTVKPSIKKRIIKEKVEIKNDSPIKPAKRTIRSKNTTQDLKDQEIIAKKPKIELKSESFITVPQIDDDLVNHDSLKVNLEPLKPTTNQKKEVKVHDDYKLSNLASVALGLDLDVVDSMPVRKSTRSCSSKMVKELLIHESKEDVEEGKEDLLKNEEDTIVTLKQFDLTHASLPTNRKEPSSLIDQNEVSPFFDLKPKEKSLDRLDQSIMPFSTNMNPTLPPQSSQVKMQVKEQSIKNTTKPSKLSLSVKPNVQTKRKSLSQIVNTFVKNESSDSEIDGTTETDKHVYHRSDGVDGKQCSSSDNDSDSSDGSDIVDPVKKIRKASKIKKSVFADLDLES